MTASHFSCQSRLKFPHHSSNLVCCRRNSPTKVLYVEEHSFDVTDRQKVKAQISSCLKEGVSLWLTVDCYV